MTTPHDSQAAIAGHLEAMQAWLDTAVQATKRPEDEHMAAHYAAISQSHAAAVHALIAADDFATRKRATGGAA
jgi:hypothetical protein